MTNGWEPAKSPVPERVRVYRKAACAVFGGTLRPYRSTGVVEGVEPVVLFADVLSATFKKELPTIANKPVVKVLEEVNVNANASSRCSALRGVLLHHPSRLRKRFNRDVREDVSSLKGILIGQGRLDYTGLDGVQQNAGQRPTISDESCDSASVSPALFDDSQEIAGLFSRSSGSLSPLDFLILTRPPSTFQPPRQHSAMTVQQNTQRIHSVYTACTQRVHSVYTACTQRKAD